MMSIRLFTVFLCICVCMLTASVIPAEHKQATDPLSKEDHYKGEDHNVKYDHEAFLGKEESAHYDELSPEQSRESLAKLVPVIDKDGDGQVTEDELKDHILYMQKRYVQNDVDRTWNNYDKNKLDNDKLTWEAYREMVYGQQGDGNEISKEYAEMAERDRRRWKAADTSKDDELDKEEYACFMHPEDCEHMTDVVVQETIDDIDKNNDGFIELDEYIGDMYRPEDYPEQKGKEPDWVQSEREMFKEQRDKDKDGKLNFQEMKEWIMPSNYDHADAEAKHLLHMADDNKDMALSKEEILSHYDVFVGSQATDYGEQLQKHDPSEL